ncbi:MAG: hypothetical protein ACI9XO_002696 [Paraglaciecola sp.]|jgi:hypothetical protein
MSKICFKLIILTFIFLKLTTSTFAQKDTSEYIPISAFIDLDSFVVTATRKGFDVDDFIELVRKDDSFFRAFHNLRFVDATFNNNIQLFDKKGRSKASYQSNSKQTSDGRCREMQSFEETITGNYFKRKKKYRYYTAMLYDRVFFTDGRICADPDATEWEEGKSGIEKHISELKKLIFSPGEKADVPFIGNKTAIFEPKMRKYYNYSIASKPYLNGADCYVFTAKVKDGFQDKKEDKTIIKYLETYFEKETFQVLARNYQLAASTTFYDFDVTMRVKLIKVGNQYFPEMVEYDGQWDIPFKKPEIATFKAKFEY